MTAEKLMFAFAVTAVVVGLGLAAGLVGMQRRLCELKTERDEARQQLRTTEAELAESRRHERQALADLTDAERRARLATNLLGEQRERRERLGFEHVNLAYPPAYPADALPDIPTAPLEDDPWVAEMRERWADNPLTSEDEY
ncbi:hypothetical protein Q0Z83_060600 [Actinoplanes sichuanensis]|uniref:Septum formation initiator n=1 Tax=Actinoplanes sichuanensis TaxID=512349 RepID=A0ABW4A6M5_9ACTN|nr:hypothetical protein [Actinoplanes sichuanensis]BEL07869.1 hypothetical protein Q0Z83_060600 [Actinoplanes sichuanensis]